MKYIRKGYHTTAIEHVINNKRCGLFLEMGLGKTGIVLSACNELLWDRLEISKILVLAPLRPARMTWSAELEKWDHLSGNRYSIVYGKDKESKIREDVEFYFMSYSSLPWLHTQVLSDPRGLPKFDVIVFDESTYVKKQSSNRWKYCSALFANVPRKILLTGTPVPNGLADIWAQVYLLDNGKRLFRNYKDFVSSYFLNISTNTDYMKLVPYSTTKERITEKISDIVIAMKSEDYVKLPDKISTDIYCELTAKDQKKYDELEEDMIVEMDGGVVVDATSSASCQMKLRQFLQGFMYVEGEDPVEIHKVKLEVMKEIATSLNGDPCLVAFQFKHEADALSKALGDAPIINSNTSVDESLVFLDRWNRGELPFLLVNPASVAHGLNIQSGGRHIVHYGNDWNLEYYDQLNARLYRVGQGKKVFIKHIVMRNTVDEVVRQAQQMKSKTQDALKSLIIKYNRRR